MNVLCIGSVLAFNVITAFVVTTFTGEERHARRPEKIRAIEASGDLS